MDGLVPLQSVFYPRGSLLSTSVVDVLHTFWRLLAPRGGLGQHASFGSTGVFNVHLLAFSFVSLVMSLVVTCSFYVTLH